jgi:serine/threonine-protein kinase RsbT
VDDGAIHIPIEREQDIVVARQKGRELAAHCGLGSTDQTLLATAISELARNIISYARCGEIELREVERDGRRGVQVIARDQGPGIADVELAMRDGYSTAGSLGLGLPGARRLVHDFQIDSTPGNGTTVEMRMWVR